MRLRTWKFEMIIRSLVYIHIHVRSTPQQQRLQRRSAQRSNDTVMYILMYHDVPTIVDLLVEKFHDIHDQFVTVYDSRTYARQAKQKAREYADSDTLTGQLALHKSVGWSRDR